jgi:hypothetical protein
MTINESLKIIPVRMHEQINNIRPAGGVLCLFCSTYIYDFVYIQRDLRLLGYKGLCPYTPNCKRNKSGQVSGVYMCKT